MNNGNGKKTGEQTLTIQQALDLAVQHHNAGRLEEAGNIYQQILKADPSQAVAMHLLGVIAHQKGNNDAAVDLIGKALAIRPDYAEALYNMGKALKDQGRLEDAAASYYKSLAIESDKVHTHYNLGNTLKELRRLEDAAASYRKALAIEPGLAVAHNNLGLALKDLERVDEAAECYRKALAAKPDYAEAHSNLGVALNELGQLDEALDSYRAALDINPDFAEAHSNLGLALQEAGRLEEATDRHRRAIALKPEYSTAHNNLGLALQELGRLDDAAASYGDALSGTPDYAEAHNNLGMLQLLRGDFRNGWENYAWRWRTKNPASPPRAFSQPYWDGCALDGKTLFIHPEQGLGDIIQFARYLPLVEARGGPVLFEVPQALRRLFEGSGVAMNMISEKEPPPFFDCHAPLLNVPQIMNTMLDTIPAGNPYIKPPVELEEQWAERLDKGGKFRLGIIWAGNPDHVNDANRSIEAAAFLPLTEIPGLSVHSLQVGRGDEAGRVFGDRVLDLAPFLDDMADTAAAMAGLDLIISADTSVVHLAGALGRPVWTLLAFMPDWRWLLERDDSPWYPSMRLFRQQRRGDWQGVMEDVCRALSGLLDDDGRTGGFAG